MEVEYVNEFPHNYMDRRPRKRPRLAAAAAWDIPPQLQPRTHTKLSAVKQELEEAGQAMLESEKKLKFKEETATAAMAAREAAERSLSLADTRASRLRGRIEELSHQVEEFETREDLTGRNRPRYVCWPWQWLGLDFVGHHRPETQQEDSHEMELF
ncbi:hypothetical protein OIU77_014884 [Salix suchowensis]|uniref:Uncharacterized protein n=1 Tax=Salix suchowensis TaxID=1278906 RepID=A0ABQ8ZZS9_9ROSI|nr:hypothetical protein OIU77_014884 [Salix suchowensis]